MFFYYQTHDLSLYLTFVTIILFMKFSITVNLGYHGQSVNSSNLLRFRDFEPRNTVRTSPEMMTVLEQSKITPHSKRKSRGFQFHADDTDVVVDLEFIVPFVKIPIKRGVARTKAAFRDLLNLNVNSLVTTGAIVAVGGIFAVILKVLFSPFAPYANNYKKTSRDSEELFPYPYEYGNSTVEATTSIPNNFIQYVESKFRENNVDPSKCIQKLICEYGQQSADDLRSGNAGSIQKIINGILSLKAVHNVMRGTAVQRALEASKMGTDCNSIYGDCKWAGSAQRTLKMMTKFMKVLRVT